MKSSIYNNLISQYRGDHEKVGRVQFKQKIECFANKFKNITMCDLI